MAQSTYGRPSDQMSDLKDKATDQFGKVVDQAERVASRVSEQGREAGERMQEVRQLQGAPSTSRSRTSRWRRSRAPQSSVLSSGALLEVVIVALRGAGLVRWSD
jgi:hypothetical protein